MSQPAEQVPVDNSRAAALSRLQAQKLLALQNGDAKAAAQIQKVIERLEKKK